MFFDDSFYSSGEKFECSAVLFFGLLSATWQAFRIQVEMPILGNMYVWSNIYMPINMAIPIIPFMYGLSFNIFSCVYGKL